MYPWAAKSRGGKGLAHPCLVDMTGEVIGDWTVLSRAPNVNGNARWLCRHQCGRTAVIEGIRLRSQPPQFCDGCRPKRPGTVERIGRGPHYCGCTPERPCTKARALLTGGRTAALARHLERTRRSE